MSKQDEIDSLRQQLKHLQREHDAQTAELNALRSGKDEARSIAESAEINSAERGYWKLRYEQLSKAQADLVLLIRYYENNSSPPPNLVLATRKAVTL